jgi:hypothetical protein
MFFSDGDDVLPALASVPAGGISTEPLSSASLPLISETGFDTGTGMTIEAELFCREAVLNGRLPLGMGPAFLSRADDRLTGVRSLETMYADVDNFLPHSCEYVFTTWRWIIVS